MKCLSGIKNDYFEYNLLYSTFGKNTIESRIICDPLLLR